MTMIRDLNTKDLAKDQNFLKKDHNCDPCNDPQTALNNGFISVLAQAAEEEFVDNNTGDLIQKITETEGVRSHDDLVANLDLYQNPNAKSTLWRNGGMWLDHISHSPIKKCTSPPIASLGDAL